MRPNQSGHCFSIETMPTLLFAEAASAVFLHPEQLARSLRHTNDGSYIKLRAKAPPRLLNLAEMY